MEQTLLQWAKEGHVPNSDAAGKERWTNCTHVRKAVYYSENEVHADPDAAKAVLKAKRKECREAAKKREQKRKELGMYRENMKTAWQWLQEGRVPNPDARWKNGESLNKTFNTCSFGSRHYYCHIGETHLLGDSEELQQAIRTNESEFNQN